MTASLCWVSPWHPGDEAAKELLSQCLGQTAACLRGLVYDHGTVEQVSTEKNRQNEINTESIHIKLDKLQQFQVNASIHSSLHSHTNKFTTCILIWKDSQAHTISCLREDAHGSICGHLDIGFVHKHSLEAGIRVAACQDLLIELKNLMKVRHGVFEQWQQLWQAEMGHLMGSTMLEIWTQNVRK